MNIHHLLSPATFATTRHAPRLRGALLATALVLGCSTAMAASPAGRSNSVTEIEATYRAERQACLDGRTGQDQATCLKEAGAARQQALSRGLDGGESPAQLQRNALARCDVVPAADRADCQRLARGEGKTSGSVPAGGVYKEIITRTVVPAEAKPVPAVPATPTTPPAAPAPR